MASEKNDDTREKTPGVKVGRARNVGDLGALARIHWLAVRTAYRLMKADGATFQEQLSAIHALVQASGSFSRLLEKVDLADEIEALKNELAELKKSSAMRKVV